ncbi:MAG: tetratricopeptide repeat protein [Chloroflexota bacterium]|nr:tetratricopeptide repeat protein [Dehalococcoidia bacterium]MDW8253753.1 tetratricopeptide repeat protein [Chloroflexota bacterium]
MTLPNLRALVDGGKLLARLGARVEAEAVLRLALSLDSESRDALLWLGAIVADPVESLALIGRAHALDPTDPRATAGLAWARARCGRLEERAGSEPAADLRLPKETRRPPDPPPAPPPTDAASQAPRKDQRVDALLEQARRSLAAGDLVETILAANEAAQLDPSSLEALALLGVAYYRDERPHDAERVYRRMLLLQPDHAEAHANLGVLAAEAGRLDEAERAYRRALESDPTLDEVRLALADLLLDQGHVDAAVREWRVVADRNPTVIEFQVKLAEAYESAQRFDEAAAAYLRAIERQGDDPTLRLRLGRVLHACGRTGAAVEQFREACRSPHATAECFTALAAALLDLGRREEAAQALDRALTLAPDDEAAHDLLSRLHPSSRRPSSLPEVVGPSRGILERLRLR